MRSCSSQASGTVTQPDPQVGWNEHWIGFDGSFALQWLQQGLINAVEPVFDVGIDQELMDGFARAIEVVKLEAPGFQQTLAGLVLQILGRIRSAQQLKQVNEIQPDAHLSVIQEAKLYLAERLEEPIDLHGLANHLAVSYSGLRRAFKVHTGFSPHQYQLELRLGEAKTLLASTVQSVKEIAFKPPAFRVRIISRGSSASARASLPSNGVTRRTVATTRVRR